MNYRKLLFLKSNLKIRNNSRAYSYKESDSKNDQIKSFLFDISTSTRPLDVNKNTKRNVRNNISFKTQQIKTFNDFPKIKKMTINREIKEYKSLSKENTRKNYYYKTDRKNNSKNNTTYNKKKKKKNIFDIDEEDKIFNQLKTEKKKVKKSKPKSKEDRELINRLKIKNAYLHKVYKKFPKIL
jgi:hypothetical protein